MLPPVRVHHPHVEVRSDVLDGSPVVCGTRVAVRRLWEWHRKGVTVETLVKRYPQLGPARVLSALAFAYDNTELVAADVARALALLDVNGYSPTGHPRIAVDPSVTAAEIRSAAGLDGPSIIVGGFAPESETPNARIVRLPKSSDRSDD